MIGVPLGLAVFGVGEWATHNYLLHGLERDRKSRLSFPDHEHHHAVRRDGAGAREPTSTVQPPCNLGLVGSYSDFAIPWFRAGAWFRTRRR